MKTLSTVKYDVMFQFRYGFYYAYLFVTVLYILLLRSLPEETRRILATILVFSDTSILGFFFIGGMVLLEKGQKTLESLFVTPLRIWDYLISKIISLTLLALLTSFAIMIFSFGASFNPIPLLIGVTFSSAFFTLLGLLASSRIKTLNGYLLISPLYVTSRLCSPFLKESRHAS